MALPCKTSIIPVTCPSSCPSLNAREVVREALKIAVDVDSRLKAFEKAFEKAFDKTIDSPEYEAEYATTYFGLIDEILSSRKELTAALLKTPGNDFGLCSYRLNGCINLVLVSSTKRDGAWQITRFDSQGEPWGDTTYDTQMQGVNEFLCECILQTIHDNNGPLLTDTVSEQDADAPVDESFLHEPMGG